MDKPLWMWAAFLGLVLALLVFDLGVLHRKNKIIKFKESLIQSGFYITIALLFGAWILYALGQEKA